MEQQEVSTIWTIIAAVIAAAVSWGGSKHAIDTLKNDMKEQKKIMTGMQDNIKEVVPYKFCRTERIDCKDERKSLHEMLEKRFDELIAKIDLQDEKRHAHANRTQVTYGELLEKITELKTKIDERSRRFRKDDIE